MAGMENVTKGNYERLRNKKGLQSFRLQSDHLF